MKLSDYVIQFLEERNVKDVFLLAGGGIMHLLDSVARNNNINKYYNLHEQASAFAADGYAQYANIPGVVFATTGPGATNTITGVASAYIDSSPMLIISGQVKTADITKVKGVRQTGGQEIGIVPIVTTITKYATTVLDAADIRYELEKAWYLAITGRKGPVWLDIPLDIQSKEIEPASLRQYLGESVENIIDSQALSDVYELLVSAKRPCLLVGSGVVLANAKKDLLSLVKTMKIPVVSSQRVKRLFHQEDGQYYYGSVGVVDSRAANYILQNSDLLLVVGSGLRYYMTAYNEPGFAPKAKKIIVNIHEPEIRKLRMPIEKALVCDAKYFLQELYQLHQQYDMYHTDIAWLKYCNKMRQKYVFDNEPIKHDSHKTDGYLVTRAINQYAGEKDIFFISSSAYDYPYNIYSIHDEQDQICPIGLGSMGASLPQAIGVCIASGKRRVLLGEGDGSLQHNIQELALLKTYNLPIKVFIDNNAGYAQIHTMQKSHFNGRYAGCDPASGVEFPVLKDIALAYHLDYYEIHTIAETNNIVRCALQDNHPAIIEVFSSGASETMPIIKSRMGKEGKMLSSKLEDMYPFVSESEQSENMAISISKGGQDD